MGAVTVAGLLGATFAIGASQGAPDAAHAASDQALVRELRSVKTELRSVKGELKLVKAAVDDNAAAIYDVLKETKRLNSGTPGYGGTSGQLKTICRELRTFC